MRKITVDIDTGEMTTKGGATALDSLYAAVMVILSTTDDVIQHKGWDAAEDMLIGVSDYMWKTFRAEKQEQERQANG